jgi:zinc protease
MRRLVLACVCVYATLLVALPARVPAQQIPLETVMPNGLRLIVVPDRLAPVVTTVMTYHVGSDDDTMPGIAHATEHMLFRSMVGLSSSEFADITARMGGDYNATTTNEFTRFYFVAPSQYLPLILRLEAMRMTGAYVADSEWLTERGAIEQEIRGAESNPLHAVASGVRHAILGDTPYARDAGGTVQSFEQMSAGDIRAFYHAWYHPNNAVLVVAGDVDPNSVLQQVAAMFHTIPAVPLPTRMPATIPPLKPVTLEQRADVSSASVAFGYRLPAEDSPDYAASLVLLTALGNARAPLADLGTSGKTTGVSVSYDGFANTAVAYVAAGVSKDDPPATTEHELDTAMQAMVANGISPDLVGTAQRQILASKSFSLASISSLAFAWADAAFSAAGTPQALYDSIARVTPQDVDRLLRDYFGQNQRITLTITPSGKSPNVAAHPFAVENVAYGGSSNGSLPFWAEEYFRRASFERGALPDASISTLPNGIRLAVCRQRTAPVVLLVGAVKMNQTLHAPSDKQGVDELTSDLMRWGGGGYDRRAFAAAADALPASIVPGSHFFISARAKDFDRALALLAAEELHPSFPEDGLTQLRLSAAARLRSAQAQPDWQARLKMEAALYPATDPVRLHPTATTIEGLTRTDIQNWYASAYRPDLTTIAVVGDVSPAFVRAEIRKYFGDWRVRGPKPDFHYPKIAMNGPAVSAVGSSHAVQTRVQLTELLPVYRDSPDYLALEVADTILTGEGGRSLLFDDLRSNAGFVYSINSTLDIGKVRSTYQFSFASNPENAAAATARLLADLRHLQQDSLTQEDVLRAKQTIIARSVLPQASYAGLAAGLLSAASGLRDPVSGTYADAAGESNDWQRFVTLTPEQIRAAFAKWVRIDDFVRVTIEPSGI